MSSASRWFAVRLHAYGAGTSGSVRVERVRTPVIRSTHELMIRVHAASVNPLDRRMIEGYGARTLNMLRARGAAWEGCELPMVVGRDFVGEVVAAGARCSLAKGAKVWGVIPPHRSGAHAQMVLADESWVSEAPCDGDVRWAGVPYAALSAASALRAGGVWAAGRRGALRGVRALVLGAGGVGSAAIQLLAHGGASVVVACSADDRERALSLGACDAIDRRSLDYERLLRQNGPYETVLDCAGLGGSASCALVSGSARRVVSLSPPLLSAIDARGVACGAAFSAVQLVRENVEGGVSVRWAFFSPCKDTLTLIKHLADRGEFQCEVSKWMEYWRGPELYAASRGKVLVDLRPEPPAEHVAHKR